MRSFVVAAALVLAPVQAQSCGTLAFTGTGAAGTTLDIAVTGSTADGLCLLAFSQNTGTTTVRLPMGASLVLGLDGPILPVPFGRLDANGDLSRSFTVPARATTAHTLQAQAVTMTFSLRPFSLSACTSNVVGFSLGG